MAAGSSSGTYTKTLTLRADLQVRAVFTTPTDEGLTGSASGAAAIIVGPCRIAPCPLLTGGVSE